MFRVTWEQLRQNAGRLLASALAIMLGAGFVAASMLAVGVMQGTTYDTIRVGYAGADLVVTANGDEFFNPAEVERLGTMDAVAAAYPLETTVLTFQGPGGRREQAQTAATAPIPQLQAGTLASGRFPTSATEVVLEEALAQRLEVSEGATVQRVLSPEDRGSGTTLTVTGLLDGTGVGLGGISSAYLTPLSLSEGEGLGVPWVGLALDSTDDGALAQLRSEVEAIHPGALVETPTAAAARRADDVSGVDQVFSLLLGGFAAVALAVATLVISNTFQVLVAQRTRSLALLRCVGATRAQVARMVLFEAAGVGLVSGVLGLGLGYGVATAVVQALHAWAPQVALTTQLELTWPIVAATLGVALAVTLLAALAPARAAAWVPPMAALRPVEGTPVRRAGRWRAGFAIAAVAVGAAALVLSAALGTGSLNPGVERSSLALFALPVGILGGLVSLVGILLGAVFVVPYLVRFLGAPLRSVPGRLAVENAVRNPRRTAATTSALVIGVTLVAMMSTGAATSRAALNQGLDENFSVDLLVSSSQPLNDAQREAVASTPGVEKVVQANLGSFAQNSGSLASERLTGMDFSAFVGDDFSAMRTSNGFEKLAPGVAVVPQNIAGRLDLSGGEQVEVATAAGAPLQLRLEVGQMRGLGLFLSDADARKVSPQTVDNALFARFAADADPRNTFQEAQAALTDLSTSDTSVPVPQVTGAAAARDAYTEVIDTILLVVVGLLAVAVVIALVGVANTLSLSVLERRRESALLRALGLTRGQLRASLGWEGVLVAATGTFTGIVLGLIYGWVGAVSVLGSFTELHLVVPWQQLAILAAVGLLAGLVASVLPARRAARTTPVEALAAE